MTSSEFVIRKQTQRVKYFSVSTPPSDQTETTSIIVEIIVTVVFYLILHPQKKLKEVKRSVLDGRSLSRFWTKTPWVISVELVNPENLAGGSRWVQVTPPVGGPGGRIPPEAPGN